MKRLVGEQGFNLHCVELLILFAPCFACDSCVELIGFLAYPASK